MSDDTTGPRGAEEIFAEYLIQLEDGAVPEFDALCEKHPPQAAELRQLHRQWLALAPIQRGIALDPQPPAGPAGSLGVGSQLGGFRLIRRLGAGGMGQVFEAEEISLRRHVALKVLTGSHRLSTRELARFRREAEAAGRLAHPNVVALLQFDEHADPPFLVQELVANGRTLRHAIDEARAQDRVDAAYYRRVGAFFRDVARALQAAHDAGVIHRDVKPHNILITPDGVPKVTDFGLAKLLDADALSHTGDLTGTYFYMSPEQVDSRFGAGADARSDVFSLGATLYESLTLTRAFDGDTPHQVTQKLLWADPPDPRRVRSKVPAELALICLKALSKFPERRYATMAAFADDLERWLTHRPITARAPNAAQRASKWLRRHPTIGATLALSAAALVAISVLLWANVAARTEAERRTAEVLSLAAIQDLRELEQRADRLWPICGERITDYRAWLASAGALLAKLDDFRSQLGRLGREPKPSGTEADPTQVALADTQRDHPSAEVERRRGELELLRTYLPTFAGIPEFVDDVGSRERELSALEQAEADLAAEGVRSSADRWWRGQLQRLVDDLEHFSDPTAGLVAGLSLAHGLGVEQRLRLAQTALDLETVYGERWAAAEDAIRHHPAYAGLELRPQSGLVPIGADPDSGLWEFAHYQCGAVPERDRDGRLRIAEETAIVLVLLPGGVSRMGAIQPSADHPIGDPYVVANARDDAALLQDATLAPFFFAKHEVTQAQWVRLTGTNPSLYGPENYDSGWDRSGATHPSLHPVEQVSWEESERVMFRLGLALPTEAQWEYAARAGTTTVWWTGDDMASLQGSGNVSDAFSKQVWGEASNLRHDEALDDGFVMHAPIGTFRANPFGLHDIVGNVAEWCADDWLPYVYPLFGPTARRIGPPASTRCVRGGSFLLPASAGQSSARSFGPADYRDFTVGLRPARPIDR